MSESDDMRKDRDVCEAALLKETDERLRDAYRRRIGITTIALHVGLGREFIDRHASSTVKEAAADAGRILHERLAMVKAIENA